MVGRSIISPSEPLSTTFRRHLFCSDDLSEPNCVLMPCQSQIAWILPPFLRQLNFCGSMALGHKELLAGESILQGLCRWSRLAKRCTQAQRPRPAGTALCLFTRHACVIRCLVCWWWCVGNAGMCKMGGGGAVFQCVHV